MDRNKIYILVSGCLFALCGTCALLVGVLFFAPEFADQFVSDYFVPVAPVESVASNPRPNADANAMGDPNAPIKIEEFSDFQCPYCKHFHEQTADLLVQQYISTGKVYFIYHSMGNFVSRNISQSMGGSASTESQDAALAAYCAGDQNKFWEMHDYLFANVLGENAGSFTDKRNKAIAKAAGLDMDQFNSCYDSKKFLKTVQQDADDGRAANVSGVPSFLLTYTVDGVTKNELIEGAQPFPVFEQTLEVILSEIDAQ